MTIPNTAPKAAVDLFGDYATVITATLTSTGAPAVVLTLFDGDNGTESDVNLVLAPSEAIKLARDLEDAADDMIPTALLAYRHAAALTAQAQTIHRAEGNTEETLDAYRRAAAATRAAYDLDTEGGDR